MGATSGPGAVVSSVNASPPWGIGRHSPAKQNQSSPAFVNFHFCFGDFRLRRSPHPAAKHRSDEVEAKPSRAAVWKASRENIQRFLADAKVPSREELAVYWTRVADHALSY